LFGLGVGGGGGEQGMWPGESCCFDERAQSLTDICLCYWYSAAHVL
jgi:hypothetical protein